VVCAFIRREEIKEIKSLGLEIEKTLPSGPVRNDCQKFCLLTKEGKEFKWQKIFKLGQAGLFFKSLMEKMKRQKSDSVIRLFINGGGFTSFLF
jgi:hypothetical protein